ncbi:diguanylate cyclase domain-containing protein [Methylobacterium sp. J-090]|uniref:diguanylate cyclase domain-containing protein n=1 Tax=Methylobacterium sp. J-090 TaxID=2836666 RepID=UPI001FBAB42A|nr:diguanylate cyclase [Methylobacterium sp. J-090]MCJ2081637.1 diguanylate cyclase [Methylobacterium sp. J-090]
MLQEIARLRAMLDTNSDWIWEVDAQGRYTYASRHSLVILGYEPSEILGRTPFDFMPPDEAVRVAAAFSDIVREKRAFAGLINHNIHRDGRIVVLETSGVPLLDDGELVGYRGIDRDVTTQEAERAWLHRLARRDDLTGLGNRLALRERLLAALADSAGPDFGVILLDLDDFKPINDTLGHGAGDLLLTLLAARFACLAAAARAQAFRLGGDEFVLVTGDGAGSTLPSVADAVRSSLTEPFELCGTAVMVSASLGMTRCSPGLSTPEDILARADAALYAAKAGRPASRARQGPVAGATAPQTRFIASGA